MPSIYLNGISIEDMGMTLLEGGPDLSGLNVQRDVQPWSGRTGVLPSPYGTVEARKLRLVSTRRMTTVAERAAFMDQTAHDLTGMLEVQYAHQMDRAMRARAHVFEAAVAAPPRWVNLDPRIVTELHCYNAAKFSIEPTSLRLTDMPIAVPCGTLSHGGRITLAGPISTEQRIKYRGLTGVLLGEIIFTPVLLAGEYGIIELDDESITKVSTTGVETNANAWASDSSVWFRPTPRHGHPALLAWPTIETTTTMLYYYRKLWAN